MRNHRLLWGVIIILALTTIWYAFLRNRPRPVIINGLIQEHPVNDSVTVSFEVWNIGGPGWAWLEVLVEHEAGMKIHTYKVHLDESEKRNMNVNFRDVPRTISFGFSIQRTSKYSWGHSEL